MVRRDRRKVCLGQIDGSVIPECSILNTEMELFCAFRMIQVSSYGRCAMTKSNLGSSPTPDLDAKAVKAIVEAQDLPPGLERTEALKKADQLCNAADIYRYVFSTELKPPQ
jgi:hypothetical protein